MTNACIALEGQKILKVHIHPDRRDRIELVGPESTVVGELPSTSKQRTEWSNAILGTNPMVGMNKWEGGVMDVHGRMYCMPMQSSRSSELCNEAAAH